MCFLYNGANDSTGVIFCLDSKTINTLTDWPIKSIVRQTTSECVCVCVERLEGAGSSNNNNKFTQTRHPLDRPVKNLRRDEMK